VPRARWRESGLFNTGMLSAVRAAMKRKHVLIVDDNEANLQTLHDYMASHGYMVTLARDGFEALAHIAKVKPDIVLMDIQMPVMDGFEAIRQLRQLPDHADTPVIAVTALAMQGDRERCLAAGANEYVIKPVRLAELSEKIDQLIAAGRPS